MIEHELKCGDDSGGIPSLRNTEIGLYIIQADLRSLFQGENWLIVFSIHELWARGWVRSIAHPTSPSCSLSFTSREGVNMENPGCLIGNRSMPIVPCVAVGQCIRGFSSWNSLGKYWSMEQKKQIVHVWLGNGPCWLVSLSPRLCWSQTPAPRNGDPLTLVGYRHCCHGCPDISPNLEAEHDDYVGIGMGQQHSHCRIIHIHEPELAAIRL